MRGKKGGSIAGSSEADGVAPIALRQVRLSDNPEQQPPQEGQHQPPPTGHAGQIQNGHANAGFSMEGENGRANGGISCPSSPGDRNGSSSSPPEYTEQSPDGSTDILNTSFGEIRPHLGSAANKRNRHRSGGAVSSKSVMSEDDRSVSASRFDDAFIDASGLTLIYSKHEKVSLKDFSNEQRAARDILSYLKNMSLLLDIPETSVDDIIEACLEKMLEGSPGGGSGGGGGGNISNGGGTNGNGSVVGTGGGSIGRTRDQAKSGLFTHDFVHQLSKTLQCTSISEGGGFDYDQNWVCAMSSVPSLTNRRVCIARLLHAANLGQTCQEVHFVIVVLVPTKEKGTKSELEVARTFGTVFADMNFRQELMAARTDDEFKEAFTRVTHELSTKHGHAETKVDLAVGESSPKFQCGILKGIRGDLRRRLPHYLSDYIDGVADKKSIFKSISCTLFLYFACLLPSIAFGVLNYENTKGVLTVEKVIYSQVFGGLMFAILGGTPQIVLLTTAPLAIYTKILFDLSDDYDLDFEAFFAWTGLFNCFFLVLFSVFDLSILMQFSTRSSEEIFALFISIAFTVDALKDCVKNFDDFYCDPVSADPVNATAAALSNLTTQGSEHECAREISLLYLLLLLGTLWLGVTLFTFRNTPYLTAGRRELLADYALPVSVIIMAVVGSVLFKDVDVGKSFDPNSEDVFKIANIGSLRWEAILGAAGLGFCLSLLFFMDQNISAALVNAPQNKMQKGTAYHWDLLVIALINAVLSLFCFPWVHAALPHSPLHVRALADVEERVDQGHIYQIVVKVRETRITGILSHILIGVSLLITKVLAYIPTPVLYGLFLYVAVTSLFGNQMFERVTLFFTEQAAYPPNHYIRRVPQRKIHTFTALQLVQLVILCVVGNFPNSYLKMFFPVFIFSLIPIRHKLIPKFIEQKYLKAMDGH